MARLTMPPGSHAGRVPQAPDLRLERDVVRLVALAGELPDEHGRGADERGLAEDEPAASRPVLVQGRLVQRLDRRVGVLPLDVDDAATPVGQAGVFDLIEGLLGVVVRASGQEVHADGARGEDPFAVPDQRPGALRRCARRREDGSRSASAGAVGRGSSAIPVEVAFAADGDDAVVQGAAVPARPGARAGPATPRSVRARARGPVRRRRRGGSARRRR